MSSTLIWILVGSAVFIYGMCEGIFRRLDRIIGLLEKANEIQWERDSDKRERERWIP